MPKHAAHLTIFALFGVWACQAGPETRGATSAEAGAVSASLSVEREPSDPFYLHPIDAVVGCFADRRVTPTSLTPGRQVGRSRGWPHAGLGWPSVTLEPPVAGYAPRPDYGFDPTDPIVYGAEGAQALELRVAFLSMLRDLNGRPLDFERLGLCCPQSDEPDAEEVDAFQVSTEGLESPVFLYFAYDGSRQSPIFVPDCLTMVGYDTQPSDQCVILTDGDIVLIRDYCRASVQYTGETQDSCMRSFGVQYCAQYNWGDACADACWQTFQDSIN